MFVVLHLFVMRRMIFLVAVSIHEDFTKLVVVVVELKVTSTVCLMFTLETLVNPIFLLVSISMFRPEIFIELVARQVSIFEFMPVLVV